MINLYYSNIKDLNLKKGYNRVSNQRKTKIEQFKFEKDKKLSCGVELLLLKSLNDIGIKDPIFKLDKNNKPYLSNYPNIHFNLSHSGTMVACGISDSQIGVDIEYNDPNIDLNIAKNYFFNNEYKSIISSPNPKDEFFNYWTLKESYMKYTSLGFKLPLNSFEIKKDETDIKLIINNQINNDIKFNLFDINSYKLAIASKYNIKKAINVNLEDLF
ncbi:MAG: 4'-phosphopantetheinyl transferase superfamily protein [Methanobacteriaceae archaeon]|nr:4'-phosphopantetheinyl transferase superfamily protein [Methanobacteriaceae archaeon]